MAREEAGRISEKYVRVGGSSAEHMQLAVAAVPRDAMQPSSHVSCGLLYGPTLLTHSVTVSPTWYCTQTGTQVAGQQRVTLGAGKASGGGQAAGGSAAARAAAGPGDTAPRSDRRCSHAPAAVRVAGEGRGAAHTTRGARSQLAASPDGCARLQQPVPAVTAPPGLQAALPSPWLLASSSCWGEDTAVTHHDFKLF